MKGLPRVSVEIVVLHGITKTPGLKPWIMAKGKPGVVAAKTDFLDFKTVTESGRTPFDNISTSIMAVKGRSGSDQSGQIMNCPALSLFLERLGELT